MTLEGPFCHQTVAKTPAACNNGDVCIRRSGTAYRTAPRERANGARHPRASVPPEGGGIIHAPLHTHSPVICEIVGGRNGSIPLEGNRPTRNCDPTQA